MWGMGSLTRVLKKKSIMVAMAVSLRNRALARSRKEVSCQGDLQSALLCSTRDVCYALDRLM